MNQLEYTDRGLSILRILILHARKWPSLQIDRCIFLVHAKSLISTLDFPLSTYINPSVEVSGCWLSHVGSCLPLQRRRHQVALYRSAITVLTFSFFHFDPLSFFFLRFFFLLSPILFVSLPLSFTSFSLALSLLHFSFPLSLPVLSSPSLSDWAGVELRLNSKETGQMVASTEVKFYNCSTHET